MEETPRMQQAHSLVASSCDERCFVGSEHTVPLQNLW